ncbi:MAG: ECF transporter S component [Lachnospiraceae bacterium]|nr:ECF transporter S component [Lachnospiraceae bacterium]
MKVENKNSIRIRYITITAMLSAVAFVLQYFEIPVPVMPSFVKLDLSDLPALVGAFAMGPVCGVLIELIKNVLHLAASQSGFVGELCNFLFGAIFVLPAGIMYKKNKCKKAAMIGSVAGAVAMAVLSFPINLLIVYPFYENFMKRELIIGAYNTILTVVHGPRLTELWQCLLMFNVPFTFVKGMISVVITWLIYKKISPVLHGQK